MEEAATSLENTSCFSAYLAWLTFTSDTGCDTGMLLNCHSSSNYAASYIALPSRVHAVNADKAPLLSCYKHPKLVVWYSLECDPQLAFQCATYLLLITLMAPRPAVFSNRPGHSSSSFRTGPGTVKQLSCNARLGVLTLLKASATAFPCSFSCRSCGYACSKACRISSSRQEGLVTSIFLFDFQCRETSV